ncbi:tripartite ATP-independent transporter solute receptor, DctP family [Desulfacinum infernum DSM 9756]|uniref:Tripartite ATP-independent transporter solute receptor, DctP family n=1 Tax=Desulfacinum infernum DSM 9756 TaxID=1121391 RepID=A0A1M5BQN8_9BACT|nr:DctP family TRAP transporter solute-binding subunit [Desulfacinum infernum]SHF44903.1 tripartite ATP-independent transporter solute receptor, DctP family [Desulfacinum infernum DSM 9756]
MRRNPLLVVCLLIAFVLASAATATAASENKPIVLTLGHFEPPDIQNTIEHPMAVVFKSIVEARTNGAIKVEIHPSSTLGKERQMMESTQMGVIQGCIIAEGTVPTFYPMIQVFSIPYLFATESVGWAVMDGPFGQELFEDLRKTTGLRVVATGRGAFRNFTNSRHPIRSPEDMKGMKFRTMQVPAHMAMVKALGAAAAPISWSEVYSALQTGVVDGQENPVGVIVSGKLYEVQKYLTLDGHVYSTSFMFLNDAWFKSLPPEYQRVVLDAGRAATTVGRGVSRLQDAVGLEKIQQAGMEVYTPTGEQLAEFRKLSQPVVIQWLKENVKGSEPWIDRLMAATTEVEQKWEFR